MHLLYGVVCGYRPYSQLHQWKRGCEG